MDFPVLPSPHDPAGRLSPFLEDPPGTIGPARRVPALEEEGQLLRACNLARDTLRAVQGAFGTRSLALLPWLDRVCHLLCRLSLLEEARKVSARAEVVFRTLPGSEAEQMARRLQTLAIVADSGAVGQVVEQARKCLAEVERGKPADHPLVLVARAFLAEIHLRDGAVDAARSLMVPVMKALGGKIGELHPRDVVRIRLNHARVLSASSGGVGWRPGAATRVDADHAWDALLECCRASLGPKDPEAVQVLILRAGHLQETGRSREALLWIQDRIRECERICEEPGAARALAGLLGTEAGLLDRLGRRSEARRSLERVVQLLGPVVGPGHPDMGLTLNNLALHGDPDEAVEVESLLCRSHAILSEALGTSHRDTGRVRANVLRATIARASATEVPGAARELLALLKTDPAADPDEIESVTYLTESHLEPEHAGSDGPGEPDCGCGSPGKPGSRPWWGRLVFLLILPVVMPAIAGDR